MATPRANEKTSLAKVLIPIVVILVIVIGGLYVIKSEMAHPGRTEGNTEIRADSVLPDFKLTRLDGKETSLSELKSKIFLLNFWATWCEACMVEMPSIVKLREEYKDRGFEVLAVNLDENPEAVVPKAIKEFKIEFPVFRDIEGKTADLFNVHAIPLTVVVNHDRKILFVRDGEENWNSPKIKAQMEKWLSE
jgi:thiol-disulfide isomerase/thioredoxin